MTWLAVGLGGALGCLMRHAVNVLFTRTLARSAPYATATVNLLGSLVIGLLAGFIASERLDLSPTLRAFVFVGILGGLTTFSSFGLDTLTLARDGQTGLAIWNVVGQVGLGLGAVFVGYWLGK
jgi:CrcB protein